MSSSKGEGLKGHTSCIGPSASASTNEAPASFKTMAGRPVSSCPRRPAHSLYSSRTVAKESRSTCAGGQGAAKAYTTSTCTLGTTKSELLRGTHAQGAAELLGLHSATTEVVAPPLLVPPEDGDDGGGLVFVVDGLTTHASPLLIFILQ